GRLADEKAGVEKMVGDEQPPLARRIAAQQPVHAENDSEENQESKFDEKHGAELRDDGGWSKREETFRGAALEPQDIVAANPWVFALSKVANSSHCDAPPLRLASSTKRRASSRLNILEPSELI